MRITVPWFAIVILAATASVFSQAQAPSSGPTFDVVSSGTCKSPGLKLESSRALLDTLIIDRLERPTEN